MGKVMPFVKQEPKISSSLFRKQFFNYTLYVGLLFPRDKYFHLKTDQHEHVLLLPKSVVVLAPVVHVLQFPQRIDLLNLSPSVKKSADGLLPFSDSNSAI
jgi:hypothetical protein